jgi:hypothetical protein
MVKTQLISESLTLVNSYSTSKPIARCVHLRITFSYFVFGRPQVPKLQVR